MQTSIIRAFEARCQAVRFQAEAVRLTVKMYPEINTRVAFDFGRRVWTVKLFVETDDPAFMEYVADRASLSVFTEAECEL